MAKKWCSVLVALAAFASSMAIAQGAAQFPSKPIRMIVPFAPGGATDFMARTVAQKMQERVGQPVIVENKPGANAILGTDLVAKAAPDGHSLVLCAFGHATNPSLIAKLPYDTLKDLAPVTLLVTGPLILAVSPQVPANNVAELIAHLKANPGKLNFASGGSGSSQHFAAELFMSMTGTKMVHVPYKGTAPAYVDLLSGATSLIFDNLVTAMPQVKAGKLKALGVTSARRFADAPDVPAIGETLPGYDTGIWHGFLTTGGTPKDVVGKLNAEIVRAVNLPDVREQFLSRGLIPVGNSPAEFDAFIRAEMTKWAKIIKEAGIQPE
jgi:tripartite-type tricarboxylate transporter receptor subunit TctC